MFRLSLALLRLFARVVPSRQREGWLEEWEAELLDRRQRLAVRHGLTPQQEIDMLRRVAGSLRDAAWLRRQFTLDADLTHDLRFGARMLRRTPGFTALAVVVLALGIGATTGIYSVVDALLIRQLPYRDAERVALLFQASLNNRTDHDDVAPANFIDWREQARTIETAAAAEPFGFTIVRGAEPESLPGVRVSQGFFDVFGMNALYGRTFAPEEYTAGRDRVVVLSYGTWAQRFGADRSVVGGVIRLNGQPHTVVGVMPAAFAPRLHVTFTDRGVYKPKIWTDVDRRIRGGRFYEAVARLKPGVTVQEAQAEADAIAARLAGQYPRTNENQTLQLVSLRDHLAGDVRDSLGVLSVTVLLLLVIAAANTAHLLMARAAARAREMALRSAIGAGRGRLVRQMLAETLLLAVLGCFGGLLVAHATTALIVRLGPGDIPALATLGVNGRVLLFSSVLTLVVTVLVGMAPAWKGARIHIAEVLSGAADDTRGAAGGRGRARFVVAELAVALTLLMAGGLLLRSFTSLVDRSTGFGPDGVAALQIFAFVPNATPGQRAAYIQGIVEAMQAVPQVRDVGAASVIPFLDTTGGIAIPILIEGRAAPAPGEEPSASVNVATPGYFQAMRVERLDGRLFDHSDDGTRAPVAVVSQAFAKRHWSGRSPIGEHLRFSLRGEEARVEVVGIVTDSRYESLDRPVTEEVFVPHAQMPLNDMTLVARASGDPVPLVGAMRSALRAVAPRQAVYRTATMSELVARSLNERRFMLALVLGFALLALALAASGVYGVMSAVSTQRLKEYGLRVALGASRGQILRMVAREGALITGSGVAIGAAGALAAGRLLRGFLFEVGPTDLWTLGGVSALLGAAAGIACLLPALRATRVSPLVALRD